MLLTQTFFNCSLFNSALEVQLTNCGVGVAFRDITVSPPPPEPVVVVVAVNSPLFALFAEHPSPSINKHDYT